MKLKFQSLAPLKRVQGDKYLGNLYSNCYNDNIFLIMWQERLKTGDMRKIVRKIFVCFLVFVLNFSCFPAYSKPKKVCAGVSDYRLTYVNIDWWDNFDDPYLKEYVFKTISHNHDLKIATLRTKEYYQNMKITFANELPTLSFMANYVRIRTPGFDFNGLNLDNTSTNVFSLPLIASYEADIFLKNHDKTKSAKKEAEAVRYQEKSSYISLASAVGTTYINILRLDKTIKLQEEIVKVRKRVWELTEDRYKLGLASTFDTTARNQQHTIAIINLNDLKKQRAQLLHQLAVLTGESPSCACSFVRGDLDSFEYKKEIPAEISSKVVINRPDLMETEAKLKKAKIDIRVARKEFLPTIPITGIAGFTALKLDRLFDWDRFLALVAASITQNLFMGGRKIANLKKQKIIYQELFEEYKQRDLQAIQEINDSLCAIKYDTKTDIANNEKVELEKYNYGLINLRYESGITSDFDRIQFLENLILLEKEKADSKTRRLIDYLSLYKAAGGAL